MIDNFGYNLLRDFVIPDILEDDTSEILYWSGKKLFTKLSSEMNTEESLISFFGSSQFGHLEIKKSSKTKYEFVLSGAEVITRLHEEKPEFSLEAGILCEYVQTLTGNYCLSTTDIKSKDVLITIDIDKKSNTNEKSLD